MGRREDLGDAAISVVAEDGLKGLTHRAVDAAADVPAGTTSNYFRTRQALVEAVAARIEERDHEIWASLGPPPATLDEFLDWLADFATAMATGQGDVTRVRVGLFLTDAANYAPGHLRFRDSIEGALHAFGVAQADDAATAFMDYVDGLLLHVATVRPDGMTPPATISANLRRLAGL